MNHHNTTDSLWWCISLWVERRRIIDRPTLCVCNSGRDDTGYETAFDDGHLKRGGSQKREEIFNGIHSTVIYTRFFFKEEGRNNDNNKNLLS